MKLYINTQIKSQLAPDGELARPVKNGRHWMKISLPSRKAGRPVSITFHWGPAPQWNIQDPAELCHLLAQKLGLEAEAVSGALFGGTVDVSPRGRQEEMNSSSPSDDGQEEGEELLQETSEPEAHSQQAVSSPEKQEAGSSHQQPEDEAVSEQSEADGERCGHTSTPPSASQAGEADEMSVSLSGEANPPATSSTSEEGEEDAGRGSSFGASPAPQKCDATPKRVAEDSKQEDGGQIEAMTGVIDTSSSPAEEEEMDKQLSAPLSQYQEEVKTSIEKINQVFSVEEIRTHAGGTSATHLRGSEIEPVAVDITPATGKFNPVKWYAKQQFSMPLHRIKDYDRSKFETPIIVYLDTSPSMRGYIPIVEGLVSSLQAQGQDVFLFLGPNGRVCEQITPGYKNLETGHDDLSLTRHLQKEKLLGMVEKIFIFADDDPHWMVSSLAKISPCDIIWYHIGEYFYEEKIDGVDYHIITSPQELRYFIF